MLKNRHFVISWQAWQPWWMVTNNVHVSWMLLSVSRVSASLYINNVLSLLFHILISYNKMNHIYLILQDVTNPHACLYLQEVTNCLAILNEYYISNFIICLHTLIKSNCTSPKDCVWADFEGKKKISGLKKNMIVKSQKKGL